jgi:transcription antitermination factor NusG
MMLSDTHRSWFAVQVRLRHEKAVATTLEGKGYEQFLPTRRVVSKRGGNTVELPLFPGYVFSRVETNSLGGLIVTTPGVLRIVGFGQRPAAIPDAEIETMKCLLRSGLAATPYPYLTTGDNVRIVRGPLQGVEGLIVACREKGLLVISISIVQRSMAVEVDLDSVVRIP